MKNDALESDFRAINGSESGNTPLYMLLVLPVVLSLLIVVVDVSAWQSMREEAQREADRIVLQVVDILPDQDAARTALLNLADNFNAVSGTAGSNLYIPTENLDSWVNSSSVSVQVMGSRESMLDIFFKAFNSQGAVFNISEQARARQVPVDASIIFSDSISLRPEAPVLADANTEIEPGEVAWGDIFDYPASFYFNTVTPPSKRHLIDPLPPVGWPFWWEDTQFNSSEYQRWATQVCYNPSYTPLKLSTMAMVDAFSVSPLNRISVWTTPGDSQSGSGFTVLKDLQNQQVNWSPYFEPSIYNTDEACVLYALNDSNYQLPGSNYLNETPANPADVVPVMPNEHSPSPFDSVLSPNFISNLQLRESIYYHAVRDHGHELNAVNIARTLSNALSNLVEVDKLSDQQLPDGDGLFGKRRKVLFVLSDQIPFANDPNIAWIFDFLNENNRFKVYLLAYEHNGLDSQGIINLNQQLESYSGTSVNPVKVNENSIFEVVRGIITQEKKAVLAS